jgi:hypothetical protein
MKSEKMDVSINGRTYTVTFEELFGTWSAQYVSIVVQPKGRLPQRRVIWSRGSGWPRGAAQRAIAEAKLQRASNA